MFNPHTKFEMSKMTCNEEVKGNAKRKNSRFEPPFGGLRGNAQGSSMARWKARCRLHITVCTVVQDCCKGRSNKYRKWHFWGSCRPETP